MLREAMAMAEKVKLNLRMPPDLRADAAWVAEAMGLSLNAFVVQAVRNWTGYQAERLVKYHGQVRSPVSAEAVQPVAKVGPNQPCPCGSGQKYKRCHGRP